MSTHDIHDKDFSPELRPEDRAPLLPAHTTILLPYPTGPKAPGEDLSPWIDAALGRATAKAAEVASEAAGHSPQLAEWVDEMIGMDYRGG
jgi:hypothetical protein